MTTDHAALKRAFGDYARTLARRYDIGEVLYRLTDQVVEVLGVDGAGVLLADPDGVLLFVTATDETVDLAEQEQIEAGEGPCHDAYEQGTPITVADLEADERWPRFRSAALRAGMRAVAGIPMPISDRRIGGLDLYRFTPHDWDAEELETAQVLADMATGYILNARTLHESVEVASRLQRALDTRIIIEQAKGIVTERHAISPPEAFEVLRAHARNNRAKLHDVARDVVENRLRL